MQQAAISGDPLKREDQVEDIKRYACLKSKILASPVGGSEPKVVFIFDIKI